MSGWANGWRGRWGGRLGSLPEVIGKAQSPRPPPLLRDVPSSFVLTAPPSGDRQSKQAKPSPGDPQSKQATLARETCVNCARRPVFMPKPHCVNMGSVARQEGKQH